VDTTLPMDRGPTSRSPTSPPAPARAALAPAQACGRGRHLIWRHRAAARNPTMSLPLVSRRVQRSGEVVGKWRRPRTWRAPARSHRACRPLGNPLSTMRPTSQRMTTWSVVREHEALARPRDPPATSTSHPERHGTTAASRRPPGQSVHGASMPAKLDAEPGEQLHS
jgi:hypothetical protein